jgi:hypothetical protein
MAPVIMTIFGDWRDIEYWGAIAFPGMVYVVFLSVSGAMLDAILQLGSQSSSVLSVGIEAYVANWMFLLGVLVGCVLMRLSFGCPTTGRTLMITQNHQKRLTMVLMFSIPTFGAIVSLWMGVLHRTSFGLFGTVLGFALCLALKNRGKPNKQERLITALLVLITAWSVSISIGFNTPVLASGLLVAWPIAYTYASFPIAEKAVRYLSMLAVAAMVVLAFSVARRTMIYREQSALHLIHPIDNLLPGGNLIKTNSNTYEFLRDLKNAVGLVDKYGFNYAIIPDNAGYWVKSSQPNPLPIDWVRGTELNNQLLVERVTTSLDTQRGQLVVITQKVGASRLAEGFFPLPDSNRYPVVQYVRAHFSKFGETEFFDLYR